MRIKWHFRNEPTLDFSNKPAFASKPAWRPPKGHPNLEVFLGQVKAIERLLGYSNLSEKQWDAKRSLDDDRNLLIKRAKKGFCVVIWDKNDFVKHAKFQLSNLNIYKSVEFKDKTLAEL